LDLCDLSIKVPRHEALPKKFHKVHLRFDTASSVVSAPVSPDCTTEIFRRPQGLVSGDCTSGDGLPRLRVLSGRYDGMGAAVSDRVMALGGNCCDLGLFRRGTLVGSDQSCVRSPDKDRRGVISPFLTGCIRRTYAAIFSFIAGVMPPMPMFGRSLLYVHSQCVASSIGFKYNFNVTSG
jgi:hypothetical protein